MNSEQAYDYFFLGANRDLQFLCHILTMDAVWASCSTSTATWQQQLTLSGVSLSGILLLSISLISPHLGEQGKHQLLNAGVGKDFCTGKTGLWGTASASLLAGCFPSFIIQRPEA